MAIFLKNRINLWITVETDSISVSAAFLQICFRIWLSSLYVLYMHSDWMFLVVAGLVAACQSSPSSPQNLNECRNDFTLKDLPTPNVGLTCRLWTHYMYLTASKADTAWVRLYSLTKSSQCLFIKTKKPLCWSFHQSIHNSAKVKCSCKIKHTYNVKWKSSSVINMFLEPNKNCHTVPSAWIAELVTCALWLYVWKVHGCKNCLHRREGGVGWGGVFVPHTSVNELPQSKPSNQTRLIRSIYH